MQKEWQEASESDIDGNSAEKKVRRGRKEPTKSWNGVIDEALKKLEENHG